MSLREVFDNIKMFLDATSKTLTSFRFDYNLKLDGNENVEAVSVELEKLIGNLSSILNSNQSGNRNEKSEVTNCRRCRKKYPTSKLLQCHMRAVHDIKAGLEDTDQNASLLHCFKCDHVFTSFQPGFRDHPCSTKNAIRGFSDESVLKDHNRFICGSCEEQFKQLDRIKAHLDKCLGKQASLTCDICLVVFDKKTDLVKHKSSVHSDNNPFRCTECSKRFKRNTSLQKHVIRAHEVKNDQNKNYQCGKCGKRFIKKLYLTNHQTRFHNLVKPILCQICGERFMTKSSLQCHLKTHEGQKDFVCTHCGKGFYRRDKLKFHLAVHTGERPFKCDLCSKSFVNKSKLDEHQRRHRGEKRFSCLVCRKMYSGSNDLRHHLLQKHPNISKNIRPNIPLTPQIIDSVIGLRDSQPCSDQLERDQSIQKDEDTHDLPMEIDIDDLRRINVAIKDLGYV